MTTEELRESLMAAPKNGFTRITPEQRTEMEAFCCCNLLCNGKHFWNRKHK